MKVKNYDEPVKINHNLNIPYISNHLYTVLMIDGSGSGKISMLLNVTNIHLPHIDNIYLYVNVPFETKYQLLINKIEKIAIATGPCNAYEF